MQDQFCEEQPIWKYTSDSCNDKEQDYQTLKWYFTPLQPHICADSLIATVTQTHGNKVAQHSSRNNLAQGNGKPPSMEQTSYEEMKNAQSQSNIAKITYPNGPSHSLTMCDAEAINRAASAALLKLQDDAESNTDKSTEKADDTDGPSMSYESENSPHRHNHDGRNTDDYDANMRSEAQANTLTEEEKHIEASINELKSKLFAEFRKKQSDIIARNRKKIIARDNVFCKLKMDNNKQTKLQNIPTQQDLSYPKIDFKNSNASDGDNEEGNDATAVVTRSTPFRKGTARVQETKCTVIPKVKTIPKYTSWICVKNNIRTEDNPIMQFIPYFGDDDVTGVDVSYFDVLPYEQERKLQNEIEELVLANIVLEYGATVDVRIYLFFPKLYIFCLDCSFLPLA